MCITTNQPDTKSNPNPNPNPDPNTKQHAVVNIELNIVACPTYSDKFIRDVKLLHRLYNFRSSLSHCATSTRIYCPHSATGNVRVLRFFALPYSTPDHYYPVTIPTIRPIPTVYGPQSLGLGLAFRDTLALALAFADLEPKEWQTLLRPTANGAAKFTWIRQCCCALCCSQTAIHSDCIDAVSCTENDTLYQWYLTSVGSSDTFTFLCSNETYSRVYITKFLRSPATRRRIVRPTPGFQRYVAVLVSVPVFVSVAVSVTVFLKTVSVPAVSYAVAGACAGQ